MINYHWELYTCEFDCLYLQIIPLFFSWAVLLLFVYGYLGFCRFFTLSLWSILRIFFLIGVGIEAFVSFNGCKDGLGCSCWMLRVVCDWLINRWLEAKLTSLLDKGRCILINNCLAQLFSYNFLVCLYILFWFSIYFILKFLLIRL